MDLAYLLDLVRQHGDAAYSFVFTYAMLNSMLALLFVGYAAHLEVLEFGQAVAACWAGGFAGDTVRFWVGRRYGKACLRWMPRIERAMDTIARLVRRHHGWMLMIYRFPHGIRGLAGFVFGIAGLGWARFLALNFVSAGIWALSLVSIGYGFGHVQEKTLGEAASGLSAALLLAFLALAWVLSRRLERAIERG